MSQPVLIMLIGPSGAGKSTVSGVLKSHLLFDVEVFSFDALRHEWYHPTDYGQAFHLACADKTFEKKAMSIFNGYVKQTKNIIVDNVNLTARRRSKFIHEAHKRNYRTVAIVLNVDVDVVVGRQQTRCDKSVREDVVRQQHASLQKPIDGEFDVVINLDTSVRYDCLDVVRKVENAAHEA